jgi:anti-sigma B factor antagonist
MEIQVEKNGNRHVIRASGRFDAAGAKVVADALEGAMAAGSHTVALDMGGVEYLSSAGIRVLVQYFQRFSQLKGRLYLTSVSDRICRLIEMTGLYELLDPPDGEEAGSADGKQAGPEGLLLTARVLEPDGRLVLHTIGPGAPEVLSFPEGTLAFGTGALGYESADCTGRYGPFLAAGGYVAFRAPGDDPDFEEYAEAYIPKLFALSGFALTGNYARRFAFESEASPPDLRALAGAFAGAAPSPAHGFVLAAECELPAGALTAPAGSGPGPVGVSSADGSRLCLVLAAGIARAADVPGALPSVTACAAFFPYQPLRRHGNVKLKETTDCLFGCGLVDVIPLCNGEPAPLPAGMRLLRGLAWTAPVQERTP